MICTQIKTMGKFRFYKIFLLNDHNDTGNKTALSYPVNAKSLS